MKLFFALCFISILPLYSGDKVYEVKKFSFYEKKDFNAYLSSSDIQKVKVDYRKWDKWIVDQVASHGQQIKKGEVLVRFDQEKLSDLIRFKESDLRLQKLELIKQRKALEITKEDAILEQKLTQLKAELAEKDEELYKTSGRERFIKTLQDEVDDAKKNLIYQQAEFSQLEKMYKLDSLAEESEEIVLQRQKDAIERAERYVEFREAGQLEMMELKLPVTDYNKTYSSDKANNASELARLSWKNQLARDQTNLENAERAYAKAVEKQAELKKGLVHMALKSSIDGRVLIGDFKGGKWNNKWQGIIKKGAGILPGETFMTVVGDAINRATLSIPVAEKRFLKKGVKVVAIINGQRYLVVPQLVNESAINGLLKVELPLPSLDAAYGQKIKAMFVREISKESLSLPLKALRYRDAEPEMAYIIKKEKDQQVEVFVEIGEVVDGKAIISAGLNEGDVVLLP